MNKKITQLENKLDKIRKDKAKAQQQKEEAENKIKSCLAQEKDIEASPPVVGFSAGVAACLPRCKESQ